MDPNIWDVSHHFERVCVRELHATVGTVVPAGFTTCTGVHAQARTAGTALDEAYAPSACWVNRNGGAPRRANAALPTEGTSDVLVRQRHVTRNDACRLATTRPAGSETVANLSVIASTRTIQAPCYLYLLPILVIWTSRRASQWLRRLAWRRRPFMARLLSKKNRDARSGLHGAASGSAVPATE